MFGKVLTRQPGSSYICRGWVTLCKKRGNSSNAMLCVFLPLKRIKDFSSQPPNSASPLT